MPPINPTPSPTKPRPRPAPRGSAYSLVLLTLTIVLVIGLTGVAAQRVRLHTSRFGLDAAEARTYAESGLDTAMQRIADTTLWRTLVPNNGDWILNQPIGRGTFTVHVSDPADGIIAGSSDDPLILTCTGVVGQARQILSVQMDSRSDPLSCLSVALCAAGDITFNLVTVAADQPITTNGAMSASGATINSPVEAVGAITGSTYNGTRTANAAARVLPGSDAFDSYITRGTAISILLIPSRRIENCVIGPGVNPYGLTNASGIYVIDCLGQSLELRNCRIYGTIVVLNAAGGVLVRDSVNMETTSYALPALAVAGPLEIRTAGTALSEASVGANLNPPGAPYSGATDNDTADSYPSSITGLIYASGNLLAGSGSGATNTVKGVIVTGGRLQCDGPLSITYKPEIPAAAPRGFRGNYRMTITTGSWAQVVQ